MMEVNEIKTLNEALEIVKAKLMIDREYMEEADIQSMTTTIRDLNWMLSNRLYEEKKKQLQAFINHLDTSYNGACESDYKWEMFTELPFVIGFNGETITLDNGADLFSRIRELLQDELDEM